jgi:uncharacterized protein (DUF4415 family)
VVRRGLRTLSPPRNATPIDPVLAMRKHYDFSAAIPAPYARMRADQIRLTLNFDRDVIEWFKLRVEAAGGGSYAALMNDALRQHLRAAPPSSVATARRIVREELRQAKSSRGGVR